jgi:hypothetical protein
MFGLSLAVKLKPIDSLWLEIYKDDLSFLCRFLEANIISFLKAIKLAFRELHAIKLLFPI